MFVKPFLEDLGFFESEVDLSAVEDDDQELAVFNEDA